MTAVHRDPTTRAVCSLTVATGCSDATIVANRWVTVVAGRYGRKPGGALRTCCAFAVAGRSDPMAAAY